MIALIFLTICLVLPNNVLLGDEKTVTIKGEITSPTGEPVDATVFIWVENEGTPQDLASTNTEGDGSYSVNVPPKSKYSFYIPPNQKESKINIFPYIPKQWKLKRKGKTHIEKDFTLHPAGNLVLRAYDYPNQIYSASLRDIAQEHIWSTNMNNIPPPRGRLERAGNQYTREHGWDPEKTTPVFLMPLDTRQKLQIPWRVPEFGKVILEADNGGKGFLFTEKGEQKIINLNYELARTRYAHLKERYENYKEKGYQFSEDLKEKLQKAEKLLEKAETGLGKVLEEEKAKLADKSLRISLYASEDLEYQKAKQAIERNKKHSVTLRLVGPDNQPIAGKKVTYEQTSHDFKFGFELHRYSKLASDRNKLERVTKKLKEAGFNLAVLTPYHYQIPGEREHPFSSYEQVLRNKGFEFKIHPVMYFAPWNTPDNFLKLSDAELKEKLAKYSEDLAKRFSYAKYWELSNEQTHKGRNPFNYNRRQIVDLLKSAAKRVKDVNPDAFFSHNVAFPFSHPIPQPWIEWDNYSLPRYSINAYNWFRLLKKHDIPFDIVALQFRPGHYHFFENGETSPLIDLSRASRYFDWYGSLGKKIHISEFKVPSTYIEQHGDVIWHRKWDEELQAEYAKKFYTIAFSKPKVNGIIWWCVAYQGRGRFKEDPQGSNLFDNDYEPRPAYQTLKDLITNEWTTQGEVTTNNSGEITFKGFEGRYQVSVQKGGEILKGSFHLAAEKDEVIQIRLE